MKRLIIQAIAGALYYSGILRARLYLRRAILKKREVCVLALHRVLCEEEFGRANSLEGMVLRELTFAKMLEFLSQNFQVISLEDFLRAATDNAQHGRPRCLVTFDDGWRDNFTTAYPLLQKFNIPATIFLVTGMVGTAGGFWVEKLQKQWKNPARREQLTRAIVEMMPPSDGSKAPDLEEVVEFVKQMPAGDRAPLLQRLFPVEPPPQEAENDRMMTWREAAEMSRNGVEFGGHTVSHPILTHEDAATVSEEVSLSKNALEENLGREGRAFAYPNGNWSNAVRAQVERAGYRCAFTTRRNWFCEGADALTIPRIIIHEKKITGYDGEFSPAIFSWTLMRRN